MKINLQEIAGKNEKIWANSLLKSATYEQKRSDKYSESL
jgi:hypothetical protein